MAKSGVSRKEKSVDLFANLKNKYKELHDEHGFEEEHDHEPEHEGEFIAKTLKTFNSISNEDDILQMYLKDVGKIKMITFQEEKRLGKLIREGPEHQAEIA